MGAHRTAAALLAVSQRCISMMQEITHEDETVFG